MAVDHNDKLRAIDEALRSPDTPEWGRVVLLCMRDDHQALYQHLHEHQRIDQVLNKILVAILTAVAVGVVVWILAGRFPEAF